MNTLLHMYVFYTQMWGASIIWYVLDSKLSSKLLLIIPHDEMNNSPYLKCIMFDIYFV